MSGNKGLIAFIFFLIYEKKINYMKTIETIKQMIADGQISQEVAEKYFPELRESEDEKIRKEILDCFKAMKQQGCFPSKHKEQYDSWIAWLEKQGEQKPEWSEEDEKCLANTIHILEGVASGAVGEFEKSTIICINWLKSLKDRVQPKQEWSKEDEWKFSDILALLRGGENFHYNTPDLFTWFKSLKDRVQLQNRWKPSEEQLKSLQEVIDAGHYTNYPNALETLYEQLKQP